MPTTEEYLQAIKERRDSKESISVDFSSLPKEVDSAAIAKELANGLSDDYGAEINDRLSKKSKLKLDYSQVETPSDIPNPIKETASALGNLNESLTEKAVDLGKPVGDIAKSGIKFADKVAGKGIDIGIDIAKPIYNAAEMIINPAAPIARKLDKMVGEAIPKGFQEIAASFAGKAVGKAVDMASDQLEIPDIADRYIKGVDAGVLTGTVGSYGGVMRIAGIENIGNMMEKSAQETAAEMAPPDPNITDAIANGVGNMGAMMIPGLGIAKSANTVAIVAPRLARFLGMATSTVLESMQEAGSVYSDIFDKTGDRREALIQSTKTFGANLPFIHYANKLGWGSDVAGKVAKFIESFFFEGGQEFIQKMISNFAQHDPVMKDALMEGFVGGIVGGGAGLAIQSMQTREQAPEEAPPAQVAPEPAPGQAAIEAQRASVPPLIQPEDVKLTPEAQVEGGATPPVAPTEEVVQESVPPTPEPTTEELEANKVIAEKEVSRVTKLKSETESSTTQEIPQSMKPALEAVLGEAKQKLKKAKKASAPASTKKGDTGPKILGVKRAILESFAENVVGPDDPGPRTNLKPNLLERYTKAGLLAPDFSVTELGKQAAAELARIKELLKTGFVDDIGLVSPKKITVKSILKNIMDMGRPQLLKTADEGWITDGRVMFKITKEDIPTLDTFKHLATGTGPNIDPLIAPNAMTIDAVTGVIGAHELGKSTEYLLETEAGRQILVNASYYEFFKERYPDAKLLAEREDAPIRVEQFGELVGLLMPMRQSGENKIFKADGKQIVKKVPRGRAEVDAKMSEANKLRQTVKSKELAIKANEKEIKRLDNTPGEKTESLIAKIAILQNENIGISNEVVEMNKAVQTLNDQAAALREEYGIEDIPSSGLVRKRPKGYKGGAKGASSGEFASDTPVEMGGMENIKPFRMPELVKLAHELMGEYPTIGGLKKYYGLFRGKGGGEIKLNPIIFQKPDQAAKTLAHEIGHLIDYLPDHNLKRGNLLGRLQTLRGFLKNTFGQLQITNKEIRDELWAVTLYWHPFDPEASSKSYNAYRKSAVELYADALSVLFTSPGTLERMAPKFYKGFFDSLDQKPHVKLTFFELQDFLNKPEVDIQQSRKFDREAMYLTAEDLWKKKRSEQENEGIGVRGWVKQLFVASKQLVVDKHQKTIGEVEALESKGVVLPPSQNPKYMVEEMLLADNNNNALFHALDNGVEDILRDNELSRTDLGDYLFLTRVANGDRQAFANPKGYMPDESSKALDFMKQSLGIEKYAKLEQAAANLREIVFKMSEEAVKVGAYNQKVFDEKIAPNRGSYAVFAVHDHLEDYISAGVKEQTGTLKEIANPYVATVMKMVALNRLISAQKAKNSYVEFLSPRGEAETAEILYKGDKGVQFRSKEGFGILERLEDGNRVGYYVDPYIAEAFEKIPPRTLDMALKINKAVFNGYFRPLYITFNIGFQFYSNITRDFQRTRRNVYALVQNSGYAGTVKSLLINYANSLGVAARRAAGIQDDLISEMIANKSLDVTFTDYSFDPEVDQFTAMQRKMGIGEQKKDGLYDKASKQAILKYPVKTLEGIRFVGNTFETVSKVAGYKTLKADSIKTLDKAILAEKDVARKEYLKEQRSLLLQGKGEFAHELAYNTRNYVGTPNWRRGGTITSVTNNIFPFSNIMIQGLKADLDIATKANTRTGFMLDMTVSHLIPKLLMFMAAYGLAGDDLKEFFGKISEYDKSNYIIIPLGFTEEDDKGNRKAKYWRIPHDESGRIVSAVFWKMLKGLSGDAKAWEQIVDFGGGQLPNLAPPITMLGTWGAYLSGRNPYDGFRGRSILSDKVHKAGGVYSLKKMVQWTINTAGLSSFSTYDDGNKTRAELFLEQTPLVNRMFKISNYGEREADMKRIAEKQSEDARRSLDRGEAAQKYTRERQFLQQKKSASELSSQEDIRLKALNKYFTAYLRYSKAIKRAKDTGDAEAAKKYEEGLEKILSRVIE